MEDNILEIKNLEVQYVTEEGIVRAVNHIDLPIPQGSTAIVRNPPSSAARCAVISTPKASPLTITGLTGACAQASTIFRVHSLP